MRRFVVFFILGVLALMAAIVATNLSIYFETRPYIYVQAADAPTAEAVVIPGAAIFSSGALSGVFKERADTAIALYKAGKVSKILVSGDNSTVNHNEVNPVRTYLLGQGIPDADIFLDHAGFDTYSTMYRAGAVFQVTSLLVASQSFHLPRAVFIARNLGINAYGVSADQGKSPFQNYLREIFADEKAVLDLALHHQPKYLGEQIPITGDGRDYP